MRISDWSSDVCSSDLLPLVFTHHTMYEQYTHYVPGDSRVLGRFVVRLSTSYANLCDRIFAPSTSVAATLRERGLLVPIEVVPTGVDLSRSEEHTSELQSLMRTSYAVFSLTKNNKS